MSEVEIKALLLQHHPKSSPAELLAKLVNERALERTPRESHIELPKFLAQLLGSLLMEFRLSDPTHIGQFAQVFSERSDDLREAVANNNRSRLIYAAEDVQEQIEILRREIEDNHQALLGEVAKVKTQTSAILDAGASAVISARERYARISFVWERYLEPMEKIIHVDGPLDDSFIQLDRALSEARQVFRYDRTADILLNSDQDRLTRLRRDALERFRVSFQEVLPLCKRLYRDSVLTTGATRLLESRRLHHRDPIGARATDALATANASTNNLLDDRHIERQILLIRNYQPAPPKPLPIPQAVPVITAWISDQDLRRLLEASDPVEDVLGAIIQAHPNATPRAVLSAYHRVLDGQIVSPSIELGCRVMHTIGNSLIDAVKVGWHSQSADGLSQHPRSPISGEQA